MGWRDINMNRRKPQRRFAVVPIEEGGDEKAAVLRKASRAAVVAWREQSAGLDDGAAGPASMSFGAGYLAGFARHQALNHGVDAEDDMPGLLAALAAEVPEPMQVALNALAFTVRGVPSARAKLGAVNPLVDAGYLTGHLESLCGSQRLLRTMRDVWGKSDAAEFYLTACDVAADRMQTHQPTMSLRFDPAERAIITTAISLNPPGG